MFEVNVKNVTKWRRGEEDQLRFGVLIVYYSGAAGGGGQYVSKG